MSQGMLFRDSELCPLISSREAFPAPIFPPPEKVRAFTERKVPCGLKCPESFGKCDPLGCSLKMFLLSAAEGLTGCSLTWQIRYAPAGRLWLVLGRSARRTKGIGCGSWVSPTSTDANRGILPSRPQDSGIPLTQQIGNWTTPCSHDSDGMRVTRYKQGGTPLTMQANENWPTPRSSESENRTTHNAPSHGKTHGATLAGTVQENWGTPRTSDAKGTGPEGSRSQIHDCKRHYLRGQAAQASPSTIGKSRGSLNAEWVAQLMGFPPEYTQGLIKACCEFWETHGATR